MLTAMASDNDRLTGLKNGADDYLTKPFEYRELLLKITNTLNQYDKIKSKAKEEPRLSKNASTYGMKSPNKSYINTVTHTCLQMILHIVCHHDVFVPMAKTHVLCCTVFLAVSYF